jgi:uncharacterized protein (TIGR02118 family)
MRKLVILIKSPADEAAFDAAWPAFLHHAERMPGLIREATGRVDKVFFGDEPLTLIHELYFDSLPAIQQALSSDEGRAAGKLLQTMTGGRMTLLVADHKEDSLENIQKYRKQDDGESTPDSG